MAKSPVRAAFIYVPNGMHMQDWTPKSEGLLGELPATLEPLNAFKNDINVFSDNNAKEYRCTSFECGKEFNSEQVKEYEKVEAVERARTPYNPRLTD